VLYRQWFVVVDIGLLLAAAAIAQQDRATFTGIVTDPSGSVVPNVKVTVQNVENNAVQNTNTNEVGQYTVPNLPVGNYRITFENPGFKKVILEGLTLAVDQTARVDARMEIGAATESVSVTAETPVLQTDSPDVATVLDNHRVLTLPLSFAGGRDDEGFAYKLTPGVSGNSWTSSINGSPQFSKEVVLDGASTTIYIGGEFVESNVSMESVEEFKVETSGLSAEFGRTGGGVFNYVLKSGTNQPHGSAVYLYKNAELDANSFSNNYFGRSRSLDDKNEWALSLGGPVYLPKIYNGKNRSFFYFSYDKYHENNFGYGSPNLTVPIPDFWKGDFSRYLTASPTAGTVIGKDVLGNNVIRDAIYDPDSTQMVGGSVVRTMFPGNVIPASRISKVSQNLATIATKYYLPTVKQADGQFALTNNSFFPTANTPTFDQKQLSIKGDQILSPSQRLSGSLSWIDRPRILIDSGGDWTDAAPNGGPLSRAREQEVQTWMSRLAHDYTLRPNLLNHAALAYNRVLNPSISLHLGENGGQQLGLQGINTNGNFPEINFSGGDQGITFQTLGYQANNLIAAASWQATDTVSWIHGRHSIKMGFDFRANGENDKAQNGPAGYTFTSALTGIPGFSTTGHPLASMLLGLVQSASIQIDAPTSSMFKDYALFVQDDFKVNQRLTLNLGLRWDYQPVQTERFDRLSNFCLTCTDPNTIGLPGAMVYAGNGPGRIGSRTFIPSERTDFGPRLGLAYKITDKLIFRSGYGIYFMPHIPNDWNAVPYGRKFGFSLTDIVNDPGNNTAAFNWDTPWPAIVKTATLDPSIAETQSGPVHWNNNGGKVGYVQQWNANLQHQLPAQFVIDVGYVGSKSTGYIDNQLARLNQVNANVLSLGTMLSQTVTSQAGIPAVALALGARYPYAVPGRSVSIMQALEPYPQVLNGGSVDSYQVPLGFATFNSLQVSLNKRYSNGLSLISNYTFSKTIQNAIAVFTTGFDAGPLDYYNLALQKAVSPNDQTHVVKIGATYELPVGTGKPVLGGANHLVNALIGGWQVSYIGNYASGTPLSFSAASIAGWNGGTRASIINPSGESLYAGFDTSKFDYSLVSTPGQNQLLYFKTNLVVNPPPFTLGTSAPFVSQIRGFASYNEDGGLQKVFSIHERLKFQFRAEAFNMLNRHRFNNPNTNSTSPLFGQVTGVGGTPRNVQLGLRMDF
jgi:hypothetical protein